MRRLLLHALSVLLLCSVLSAQEADTKHAPQLAGVWRGAFGGNTLGVWRLALAPSPTGWSGTLEGIGNGGWTVRMVEGKWDPDKSVLTLADRALEGRPNAGWQHALIDAYVLHLVAPNVLVGSYTSRQANDNAGMYLWREDVSAADLVIFEGGALDGSYRLLLTLRLADDGVSLEEGATYVVRAGSGGRVGQYALTGTWPTAQANGALHFSQPGGQATRAQVRTDAEGTSVFGLGEGDALVWFAIRGSAPQAKPTP